MKILALAAVAAVAIIAAAWLVIRPTPFAPGQSAGAGGTALAAVSVPETLSEDAVIGEYAFNATCAACHGENAAGVADAGPPLVHQIYEPSHHGDMAFLMAVQNGARAHHWDFGDMPQQDGLTEADVANIVTYVRELQRANGIE